MSTESATNKLPGEYRLDVEDFGPIAKASVDVRPLTVFIGPSNTGKSYLAILIYALHQVFGSGNAGPYGKRSRYLDRILASMVRILRNSDEGASDVLDRLGDWLSLQIEDKNQSQLTLYMEPSFASEIDQDKGDRQNRTSLPPEVVGFIRSSLETAEGFDSYWDKEIGRCFGVRDLSSLVRRSGSDGQAKVQLRIPQSNEGAVEYELGIHERKLEFSARVDGSEPLSSEIDDLSDLESIAVYPAQYSLFHPRDDAEDNETDNLSFVLAGLAERIFRSLLRPLCRNAYYLPAGRTGFIDSREVVMRSLVQDATTDGYRSSFKPRSLSGVFADFLSHLIDIGGESRRFGSKTTGTLEGSSEELARRLERNIIKGTIETASMSSGFPRFDYRPHGWRDTLPLMRASSMVSELAPVVLYLRHLVDRDDTLIIEEPESHLHPAMQVEFIRQLAGLVRAGIRVIVTTHSEWVLQELANLVRAAGLPESERAGIAGGDVALDPDQVGAWLFKPDATGEGSTVNEIPLDGESGLYPTDFEDVAVAMHNDWAEIFSRLGEDE